MFSGNSILTAIVYKFLTTLFILSVFSFSSCKQAPSSPPEQAAPAQEAAPAQAALSIELPSTPNSNQPPAQTQNAGAPPAGLLFQWDLKKIRTSEDIQNSIERCASKFSVDAAGRLQEELVPWLKNLRACEAAAASQISICESLQPYSSSSWDRVGGCKESAYLSKLMYSLASNNKSHCRSALENFAPFKIRDAATACDLLFKAHESESENSLLEFAKGPAGSRLDAEELFWIFGPQSCAQKIVGRGFSAQECKKYGSRFNSLKDAVQSDSGSCRKDPACAYILAQGERPACKTALSALGRIACLADLQKSAANSSLSESFFKKLTHLRQNFKVPE